MMIKATNKLFADARNSVAFDIEVAKLDFALELKRHMDEKNLKNVDLAQLLEVSKPMITKLLRGDANVTIETMVKASRALEGKLLLRIVRDNFTAKVFEHAKVKVEVARTHGQKSGTNVHKMVAPAKNKWNFLASNDPAQCYEAKSA